jgi:malonate-semialdehyde dehydrogenase (acetylating) / methylmalonate-semialdehyde dehydrogenase
MSVPILTNYVDGAFVEADARGLLDVENPSTGAVIAQVPLSTASEVDRAVKAAAAAFPAWSATPVARRVRPLFELAERMRRDEEALCRVLVEEMGKSLPDARAEMKRAIENLEVACGMPMLQQGEKLVGSSFDIDGEILRVPVGVFGMIAPYNFPAMVPFWFLPYAIATGNTFVVKASEQVPNTLQRIFEHLHAVGLPPGVVSLVHGDRIAAEALVEHPAVAGISFVGSTTIARQVAAKCATKGKRCQALGSAKNHLVVMPDARLDEVVRNMVSSCYGCAGQRCMASSAIVAVGDATYRATVQKFVAASREVAVADPLDPAFADEAMLMGPVISARHKAYVLQMIDQGIREGATLALDGRGLEVAGRPGGHYIGPTVLTDVRPGMAVHQAEIFGPVVVMLKADSFEEAVGILNDHPYGNGASLYTQSGYWARRFKLEARAGMLGINVGIPAPVAYLPFGGTKASAFADIKAQGREVVSVFTESRIVTERYWPEEG